MSFIFGQASELNLVGVKQHVIDTVRLALKLSSIDFGIPKDGGLRTDVRQHEMYLDPDIETKCDGYDNKSNHQDGNSVDVYAYVRKTASWLAEHLSLIAVYMFKAAALLGHRCEWGGTWFSAQGLQRGDRYGWDMGHFNIFLVEKV